MAWTSVNIVESSWEKPFVFNGLECSMEVFDVFGEEEMERVEGIEPLLARKHEKRVAV